MTRVEQLPYLLKLLDDDSPVVRESVFRELDGFGTELEEEISLLPYEPTPEQCILLEPLLVRNRATILTSTWPEWFDIEDDKLQLESAMSLLAEYQLGYGCIGTLGERLDLLAKKCSDARAAKDPVALARFLFNKDGLHGAAEGSYYQPSNSNLVIVLEKKKGIPLSLACVYILVADRLGLIVEGCNLPGHFLAIAVLNDRRVVVDCFNGGRLVREEDLEGIKATITMEDILRLQCRAPVIITRAVRNLIAAYQHAGDDQSAELMTGLLHLTETALHLQ